MKRRHGALLILLALALVAAVSFRIPIYDVCVPLIQGLRGQGTVADGIAELEKLPGEG